MIEGYIEVDPETQWCPDHWERVLSTMVGPEPVNGLLATIRIFKEWMSDLAADMGNTFPSADEAERAMSLFMRDCPLCCHLGDERLQAIYSTCIVPARFRRMGLREGHLLHMQEEIGAMVIEAPSSVDIQFPQPPTGSLN